MSCCPRCFSTRVRRSHFQSDDFPWLFLLRVPYRCRECGRRFRRPAWAAVPDGSRGPSATAEQASLDTAN